MSDPVGGCSLLQLIDGHAGRNPDAAAILAPGRRPLTYGLLSRQVADVVRALNALGVGRHDRVATVIPDGPEMAVACLAVAAGATCAPLNPAYHAGEFEAHLARLHCRALLVPAGSASPAVAVARARGIPVLELIPVPDGEAGLFTLRHGMADGPQPRDLKIGVAEPDDVALVLQTSGTAARPKVVPLTHRNVCAAAQNIRAALELTPGDRCLNVMPLFHIHGLSALFASMAAGASVVCTRDLCRAAVLRVDGGVSADVVYRGAHDPPGDSGQRVTPSRRRRALVAAIHPLRLRGDAAAAHCRYGTGVSASRSSKPMG